MRSFTWLVDSTNRDNGTEETRNETLCVYSMDRALTSNLIEAWINLCLQALYIFF